MTTFTIYLIFLIKTDERKLLNWIDFLYVSKSMDQYAKRHNLTMKSVKFLYFLFDFFVFYTKVVSFFYLLVVFMFCIESLLLNISKNISLIAIFIANLPTFFTTMFSMIWLYITVSKIVSIFILFNIFQVKQLDKLSLELARRERTLNDARFVSRHLFRFRICLKNFKNSQNFFNYAIQLFLGPLFLTMVYYPYAIIVSQNLSVNFLIISYSLSIVLLLQVFSSASFFKQKVSIVFG